MEIIHNKCIILRLDLDILKTHINRSQITYHQLKELNEYPSRINVTYPQIKKLLFFSIFYLCLYKLSANSYLL